jgi:hypothetical protein
MFTRPWFLLLFAGCLDSASEPTLTTSTHGLVDASFVAQGLAGKCISVDAKGTRLVLATCQRRAPEQEIRVVELPGARQVELRMLGLCVQPLAGFGVPGVALELATCTGGKTPGQEWILDGDSIRLAPSPWDAWPNLFITVHDHSGVDGSPLTIEARRFDDSDYWELTSTTKAGGYPTSGFVSVTDRNTLLTELDRATPGSVIEVAEGASIELYDCNPGPGLPARLQLGDRVTLRGGGKRNGRRPVHPTARLHYDPFLFCLDTDNPKAIEVVGTGARITNLYLEGRSVDKQDDDYPKIIGIFVHQLAEAYNNDCKGKPGGIAREVEIDHMDLSGWKAGAVAVYGWSSRTESNGTAPTLVNGQWVGGNWTPLDACRCDASLDERASVVVAANYIHHNTAPLGYGVLVSGDGHALIQGNTFLHNRHAISAPGVSGVRYEATGNLVQSHGEDDQDFDVHGSANCGPPGASGHRGGVAGERIDIVYNTFLGNDRNNFYLRGTPCLGAEFAHNVTRQQFEDGYTELESTSQAVKTKRCGWEAPIPLDEHDNRYEIADPTADLVVGDFNGDGRDDLFMATGAAHYVSLDATGSWQLRGYGTERIAELRFGDFDGDGRTDLLRDNPGAEGIQIRFGAEGDWVNKRPDVRVHDLAVGDFNGDGRADLLWTTGTEWKISFAGSALWAFSRADSRRVADLRIGRIDAGATSDILVVAPNCSNGDSCWAFFPGGTSSTALLLGPARAPIAQLAIADANGDGLGDLVRSVKISDFWVIDVSLRGADPFTSWAVSRRGKRGAIGRFNSSTADTAVVWDNLAWRSQQLGEATSRYLAWFEMF